MSFPIYDIFRGKDQKNALWISAVKDLAEANERMQQLCKQNPDDYFVFSMESRQIVASTCPEKCLRGAER